MLLFGICKYRKMQSPLHAEFFSRDYFAKEQKKAMQINKSACYLQ